MTDEEFKQAMKLFHVSFPNIMTTSESMFLAYRRLKNLDAENFAGGIELMCDEITHWPYEGNFIAMARSFAKRFEDEKFYKMTPEEYARQMAHIEGVEAKRRGDK